MSKKNIYLVQVSAVYGESVKSAYLPYSVGCLASYAFNDEKVRENYNLGRFIFTRENIEDVAKNIIEPFLVGFSSYIWNTEYNKALAEKIKEKHPKCIIVFGGHNISPDGKSLENMPYCDILMHSEGEVPFKELLCALIDESNLANVSGISFRKGNDIITNTSVICQDISTFPSPYLSGVFDGIIKSSGISPSVIWETNRGCPNRCAFCDWGALKAKVRHFPMERIKAEIKWMADNKIEYVYCADANFGLFSEDEKIADLLIESKEKYGYPKVFKTNYTKNRDEVVFDISRKLIEQNMGKSPTLSFQSLDEKVLKNIGRSNMELEHFKSLMTQYNKSKIPVYSELILGLPGETYDSFSKGIGTLLSCNQHTCIGVYPCELLPNSLLGSSEYAEKFSIKTVHTKFSQYHVKPNENDISEYSDIIIATDSMNTESWKKSFIFSICVQGFHNLALLRAFAIYLYKEKNVSYKEFYEKLICWLENCDINYLSHKAYMKLKELTDGVCTGESSFAYCFGEKEILTWTFEEYIYLFLASQKDVFYKEVSEFLKEFFDDEELFGEIMNYQKSVIKTSKSEKLILNCKYDFFGYFQRIYDDCYEPLTKKNNTLIIENPPYSDFDEWARLCVWYGRRDDAQIYTGKKNKVVQSF